MNNSKTLTSDTLVCIAVISLFFTFGYTVGRLEQEKNDNDKLSNMKDSLMKLKERNFFLQNTVNEYIRNMVNQPEINYDAFVEPEQLN